jgi:hypothetical protein
MIRASQQARNGIEASRFKHARRESRMSDSNFEIRVIN